MTLLIFFAVVLTTIIFAIVLERIIHCPILVGFTFFSLFLIVAAIFDSVTFVIIAIILGILAFIVSLLDCIFRHARVFRNNSCFDFACDNENIVRDGRNICENKFNDTFTILNANGSVVAKINGNTITCIDNNSSCNCRNNRGRRG